jgi:hemerythrin
VALEWRQQLSVGNDVIDNDHKYLIGLINGVEMHLRAQDMAALKKALDALARYSETHFAAEEKIARAVGYTQSAELHDAHQTLLGKLELLRLDLGERPGIAAIDQFSALLRDWLINHVIKEDLLMKPFLQKYSPRFDPR